MNCFASVRASGYTVDTLGSDETCGFSVDTLGSDETRAFSVDTSGSDETRGFSVDTLASEVSSENMFNPVASVGSMVDAVPAVVICGVASDVRSLRSSQVKSGMSAISVDSSQDEMFITLFTGC